MALPNSSFILGALVFLYLLTFVCFAVIRIITGVSIQRLGFSSIRHVAYTPRDGLKLEARGLGLKIHRPTFAQPTWLSLVITELKVTLDVNALGQSQSIATADSESKPSPDQSDRPCSPTEKRRREKTPSKIWSRLTEAKNKIKRVHRIIPWLRLVDLVAERSSCIIVDVGTIHVGSVLLSVDTRRSTVDRSRLFQHTRSHSDEHRPCEWTLSTRSVLFTPHGEESSEIIDNAVLNIHGFLHTKVDGLRDASVSLKVGRLHIPYDNLLECFHEAKRGLRGADTERRSSVASEVSEQDASEFASLQPDSSSGTLLEANNFIASTLRGIRQVSVAVGFLGISKRVSFVQPSGVPLYVNMSMQELGFDLYRLDPSTPSHSMYFARSEVAHQALISAISLSVGIDDGHAHPERLAYVPMTTATIRTTLPAKLLQFSVDRGLADLNSNIFFANLVITSPSVDLDPQHLPVVFAMIGNRPRSSSSSTKRIPFTLASQLLPRSSIKLSVHEPVIRVSLPPVEPKRSGDFDFDLLISAISFVSLDIDSSHTFTTEDHYSATFNFRIASHKLYYQTTSRKTHDLLVTDSIGLKAHVNTSPELAVIASASLSTFSMYVVRPEISEGIRQIVHQLRTGVRSDKKRAVPKSPHKPSSLRSLPKWLHHFEVDASDFNIEVAGVDEKLSSVARGFAIHLDTWTSEYNSHKEDTPRKANARRRASSQTPDADEIIKTPLSPEPRLKHPSVADPTDGRRMTVHVRGLEAFVMESLTSWESEPCISIPRGEVAFTTSNDGHAPILHVHSLVKSAFVQYSLFKHYAISVALVKLKKTFSKTPPHPDGKEEPTPRAASPATDQESPQPDSRPPEYIVVDTKAGFIQVKMHMPENPHVMFHIEDLHASRHRWTTPFVRSRVLRLLAEHPAAKQAWTRIVSIKSPRVDFREGRKKSSTGSQKESSIDAVAEALRIGVPHQFIVHKVIDNFINTAKTVIQLNHRFKTDSDEYVLQKHPEGPKHVPKVSLRVRMVLFEIEDGAFEWKLGAIFRTGLVEQKQRIAREAAFEVKCQRLRGASSKHMSSMFRSSSQHSRKRDGDAAFDPHDRGQDRRGDSRPSSRHRSVSPAKNRKQNMRYDREGTHGISSNTQTTIDKAWQKLQVYNAQSWKKRIDSTLEHSTASVQDIRTALWGSDDIADEAGQRETIMQTPHRPALMAILMSDLTMNLDKPSFPLDQLPEFMHRVGKGLPLDTKFSLLIPMNAHFDVGELQISLRDYPLPLLHIPAIKPGQSPRLPSWSLRTDFVIGEEFRDYKSTRDLQITVIPADKMDPGKKSGRFAVDVRRTVSPVKMYSDIKLDINTARDTKITWGTSYQPAIQDTMQVIEAFTKPQVDPSPKVGFWDKLRLIFHSKISVTWTGGGDTYLTLKGSRSPYIVTGHGAGFVLIWRNNVKWNVWQEEDPTKFMTVDSGDFVLAIPDFSYYARKSAKLTDGQARAQDRPSNDEGQTFKKVIMKLSGRVQWTAGLVFERNLDEGRRSFEFEPHYDVTLQNPVHLKELQGDTSYDAFNGFRSNHIHMSIGVAAPSNHEWTASNLPPASNYNAIHLSPRFFTHFFSWWGLFSGSTSLPVRQGRLFPNVEKSGKKFGRHIATVKYSVLLSPLFISHVYIHKDAEEFSDDVLSATGLKVRLNSFVLDLHQRREEFRSEIQGMNKTVTTKSMRINQTLLDLVNADMRAVSCRIGGTSIDAVNRATAENLSSFSTIGPIDLASFNIPDRDYSWVDVDDFVEVDWTLPYDQHPKTWILPLAYSPRFTYRRQTDHEGSISGDPNRHSPFGYEPTHYCVMASPNDSRRVQIELLKKRLEKVEELQKQHTRSLGELELRIVREVGDKSALEQQVAESQIHGENLEQKKHFLARMLKDLYAGLQETEEHPALNSEELQSMGPTNPEIAEKCEVEDSNAYQPGDEPTKPSGKADQGGDFNNRFVVHNAQIKWNNPLRNTMLRYIHQVSQRRGFIYYTSRRAVKFILDIMEEQNKSKEQQASTTNGVDMPEEPETPATEDGEQEVRDRVEQLINDGKKFVSADDSECADGGRKGSAAHHASEDVAHDFLSQNTYHVRLVAPQIQLQSEKNPKAVIIATGRGMRLKVFQIMDKDRILDEVSGLVQTRFSLEMDNLQFFITTKQSLSPDYLSVYSGNSYGTSAGSSWPPWAPIEAMFHFDAGNYGFSRVVQRTSATIRYDKYNKLRLKYNDNVSEGKKDTPQDQDNSENRIDQFWVDFPHLRAICDSAQYYAMYIIVLDLLMWSEPLGKVRNERLEKIMLASDFSDLTGTPEMVIMLQERIRQLEEIKTHFHVNEKYLDRQGWEDRISMEQDLASCEDELFFIMKAITTAQRRHDDRSESAGTNGVLRYFICASEIVWHLTKDADVPLAEFQLGDASFERTDNSDGSNYNSVEIDRIQGLSLLPNAMYPQTIVAYTEHLSPKDRDEQLRMLRVSWYQLEAIAGINVVDHFEMNLHPLKIQLEYETGKKLFEYIFPGSGVGEDGFQPFLIKHQLPQTDEEDEDEEAADAAARNEALAQASNNKSTLGSGTGMGNLTNRLLPTHALVDYRSSNSKQKSYGLGIASGESQRFKLFNQGDGSKTSLQSPQRKPSHRTSQDNISISSRQGSIVRTGSTLSSNEREKRRHFSLHRSGPTKRSASADSRKSKTVSKKSDDLSQMLSRASNYMTLAYVKIPSVVLCLSYKGKGSRNFEDVHDLVFRMPTLEYRNKTWSSLDLALALKKDVIRALISHTGTIISNKFHHKPGKSQQSRLRELVSSSVVLSSNDVSRIQSSASSVRDLANSNQSAEGSPLPSGDAGDYFDGSSDMYRTESMQSDISTTSDVPEIEVRSPGGTETAELLHHEHHRIQHQNDGNSEAKDESAAGPSPRGAGRSALTRHFSELTQKASTMKRGTTPSDEQQLPQPKEETTPKRQMLVKKILNTLDLS